MSEQYCIKDVSSDLSFLLTLTKLFEPDDKLFWFDPGLGKRYVHKLDSRDEGKEIAIFQDPLPRGDFYFFNPYSEGFGKKSPAVQMFYNAIRVALNLNFSTAMIYIAKEVLAHKADNNHKLPHTVIRMTSAMVDKKSTLFDLIDEKMVEEFTSLFSRMGSDCIFTPYMSAQMTTIVKMDVLTDPKWDEKFGEGIRKKTIQAFKTTILGVLGISTAEDLNTFSVKYNPDLNTSAKLYTTLSCYLKLYSKFNDILADAFAVDGVPSESQVIDLDELRKVIDRSSFAYAIAKHMVQPVAPKQNAVDVSTSDTSRLTIGGNNNVNRPKFQNNDVTDRFGNRLNSGPEFSFSSNRPGGNRFTPDVIQDRQLDPFAPMTREPDRYGGGLGVGSPFSGGSSGYSFGGNSGGLNLNPPSNFNSPSMRTNSFGRW